MELVIGTVTLLVAIVGVYIAYLQLRQTPSSGRSTSEGTSARADGFARAFISYARKDGESFALDLLERIQAEHIYCWLDRSEMRGGEDWWLQIKDALEKVEYLVLVMTPGAIQSEWTRKEWVYARQQGVCVLPVMASKDLQLNTLPRWMRDKHFYDLEREWSKFINDLNTTCQQARVPFMVDDLPTHFVDRSKKLEQLIESLLNENTEEPKKVTVALKGAGGFGKTTLATAVCYDHRINRVFDDGILWVTLGEKPRDLVGKLSDLIIRLGGENPGYTSIEAASDHFAELLADRDILLVIDDVWDAAHLRPFLRGGKRCTRLITTRNSSTLPLGTLLIDVDELEPREALDLLQFGLPTSDERELADLAHRLGNWPLLLSLVNRRIHERVHEFKQPLHETISYVDKALRKRGIIAFDILNTDQRNLAAAVTISLSLELLDAKAETRFLELAVFPEDIDIPLATLAKYWNQTAGLDELDTEELCEHFSKLSLLQRYDLANRTIRLHDVIRSYLVGKVSGREALLHATLLDAYTSCEWNKMPEHESYMWKHLVEHLIGAHKIGELTSLVKDLRFLEKKTWLYKAYSVEKDILLAKLQAPTDEQIESIYRIFRASGHLFNQATSVADLQMTLCTRFMHVDGIEQLVQDYARSINRPCLLPSVQVPDLPHPAQLQAFAGHRASVESVLISEDGTTIVSGASDGTLMILDTNSRETRYATKVFENFSMGLYDGMMYRSGIFPVVMTQDGRYVVTKGGDYSLRIWDTQTGELLHTANGNAAVLSQDESAVIFDANTYDLQVWDTESGKLRHSMAGHWGDIRALVFGLDGATIISTSDDRTIRFWDTEKGELQSTLEGHLRPDISSLVVSADGHTIFSGSRGDDLCIWDIATKTLSRKLEAEWEYSLHSVAFSPTDGTILVATDDGLKTWDLTSGNLVHTLNTPHLEMRDINRDGSIGVAVSLADSSPQNLQIWDLRNNLLLHKISEIAGHLRDVRFSENNQIIVVAGEGPDIYVVDTQDGKVRFHLAIQITGDGNIQKDGISGFSRDLPVVSTTADGNSIVVGLADGYVRIWDIRSGELRQAIKCSDTLVKRVSINPDGKTVLIGLGDGRLAVWNLERGEEKYVIDGDWPVAFSPDGRTFVSVFKQHVLQRWNVQARELHSVSTALPEWPPVVAISPDGKRFVTEGYDGYGNNVQLWDIELMKALLSPGVVRSKLAPMVAFNQDGSFLIATSSDGIFIWETQKGDLQQELPGERFALSRDATKLVFSNSDDSTLKVWDLDSMQIQHTLSLLAGHFLVAISPDHSRIISASEGGSLTVQDVRDGGIQSAFHGHAVNRIINRMAVDISSDSHILVSGESDGSIRMWDLQYKDKGPKQESGRDVVKALALNSKGTVLVSSSPLQIWDMQSYQVKHTLEHLARSIIAISSDGTRLVSASDLENNIKIWDVKAGELLHEWKTTNDDSLLSVAIGPDGRTVVAGSYYGKLYLYNLEDGYSEIESPKHEGYHAHKVEFSPRGDIFAADMGSGAVQIWETKTRRMLHSFEYDRNPYTSSNLYFDGNIAVSSSHYQDIWVWDVRAGSLICKLGEKRKFVSFLFAPVLIATSDGSKIISSCPDHTLQIWDTRSASLQHTLNGHTRGVTTIAVSPDGKAMASGSDDGTLRIWDIETGAKLACVFLDGEVKRCMWHPNDSKIVVAGAGGVYFFDYLI